MIRLEFVGLTKNKVVRRAMDFWYRKFYGMYTLREFFIKCTWKMADNDYVVIYRGPAPSSKK